QAISENGWDIEAILLTHGHFDHIGAASALRGVLGIPIMAHELADRYLLDARMNLSAEHGRNVTVADTMKFTDGDRISLSEGNLALNVLHVPGHTDDSCAFYCEEDGFSLVGDTVYEGEPGLTVFPTGDAARLHGSIRSKLLALPDDTLLLSGHSSPMLVRQLRLATR
ncbi:MAG: MBL fold metallo-hydrolase, partial [Eggerthellaceae bacterium]|nr:MBL fold metallo-hydrolase [Eggerthellaceae bacterium]